MVDQGNMANLCQIVLNSGRMIYIIDFKHEGRHTHKNNRVCFWRRPKVETCLPLNPLCVFSLSLKVVEIST